MDTWALQKLALKCSHFIETFRGVWSADNFPLMKEDDASPSFQIVNTEASNKPGKHWILLCKRTKSGIGAIIFWDSLGKRPRKYKVLFERLNEIYKKLYSTILFRATIQIAVVCIVYLLHIIYHYRKITKQLHKCSQRRWLMSVH